jgi:hypothetical protein
MSDYSDFTFILASRNDGYACLNQDWQQEQIKKIECCIYSSEKTFPNRKFILLDYNPPKQNKKLKELFSNYKNLKIITINENLQNDLNADNKEGKISFYEFVAKHIGSLYCETENMVFINQDLVLPENKKDIFAESVRSGEINIAYRCKVDYNLINLSTHKLYDLCNSPFAPTIKQYDVYGNGDFLAIKKEKYEKIGGYLLSHQNWAVDNEILLRMGLEQYEPVTMKKGVINKIVRHYYAFSLDHPEDTTGAARKRGENFIPISSTIINNLKSYVVDVLDT